MKRTVTLGLLLAFAFLWYRGRPASADDKGPAKWETETVTVRSVKLEFQVLRLWNSTANDPSWPELTLLRLSPKVYEEFREDPKGFIDGDGEFKGKPLYRSSVHVTGRCLLPEAKEKGKEKGDADETSWLVVFDDKRSHIACTTILQHRP
jgi:hypothetical protein